MDKNGYVSCCGIDCTKCKNYKQNYNCAGCKEEENLVAGCLTRECVKLRRLRHCGDCGSFPCAEMDAFYGDGDPMHSNAYLNLREIVNEKKERQRKLFKATLGSKN